MKNLYWALVQSALALLNLEAAVSAFQNDKPVWLVAAGVAIAAAMSIYAYSNYRQLK